MRYVMMVPLRRCGSNAIRVRLNLHPDFHSPYPLHVRDLEGKQYPQGKEGHFQMVADMVSLQKHSLVPWEDVVFDPIDIYESVKDQPASIYQVYWEMLRRLGVVKNVSVVMDKSQDSICDFEEILQLFPDMLFLDVVRDPRAQISSMNQAIIYDFETQLNTQRWVEARKWCDCLREKYPNQMMTIRYEDFIRNEKDTMRSICLFLGLSFDPIVLEIEKSREALHMSNLSPLWETNYCHPIPSYIEKYRKSLSRREVEHIEFMTLPWMKQYHYLPETNCLTPLGYSLADAKTISQRKQQEAWLQLKEKHLYDYILRKSRKRLLTQIKLSS